MRRLVQALIGLAVLGLAIVAGTRFFQPPVVTVVEPVLGPAIDAVYATGVVEPSLEIRIAPRAAGRIVELLADEGDAVRKGQLLARLEDADLQASVEELKSRVEYAKSQHDRLLKLSREGLVSADAADKARTDLEQARATLKRANDQLGFMRLVAPVDGQIIRRDGEVGEYIPVNQIVFYMAGPEPLRITADVDEEDVPRIRVGLPVMIRTDAYPDRVFDGTVDQVTPRGDSVARSYRVRIRLAENPPLQIGMTAETNIVLAERKDALLVPSTAVVDGAVWIVKDGRAVRLPVETGVEGITRTEIRKGLSRDQAVIVEPPEGLRPGDRLRVAT